PRTEIALGLWRGRAVGRQEARHPLSQLLRGPGGACDSPFVEEEGPGGGVLTRFASAAGATATLSRLGERLKGVFAAPRGAFAACGSGRVRGRRSNPSKSGEQSS